jgi:hypothetical protein
LKVIKSYEEASGGHQYCSRKFFLGFNTIIITFKLFQGNSDPKLKANLSLFLGKDPFKKSTPIQIRIQVHFKISREESIDNVSGSGWLRV